MKYTELIRPLPGRDGHQQVSHVRDVPSRHCSRSNCRYGTILEHHDQAQGLHEGLQAGLTDSDARIGGTDDGGKAVGPSLSRYPHQLIHWSLSCLGRMAAATLVTSPAKQIISNPMPWPARDVIFFSVPFS